MDTNFVGRLAVGRLLAQRKLATANFPFTRH